MVWPSGPFIEQRHLFLVSASLGDFGWMRESHCFSLLPLVCVAMGAAAHLVQGFLGLLAGRLPLADVFFFLHVYA
jgi:hypothetical protein